MTLADGRSYLAIPGPSVVPDRVLRAMHRASPNIYTGELVDMVPGIITDLKKIAGTRHNAAIYIANGHGTWEAAISNVLNPGDRVLLLSTGIFGHGWGEIATGCGARVQTLDFGRSDTLDLDQVRQALKNDPKHAIRAVIATHVDTSSSVRNDIASLRRVMDQVRHPALLMVDCIASLACDPYEMDNWGVDVTVAASQKGLMTPPGMGFVFFNNKASQARKQCKNGSWYWDWRPRSEPREFYQLFGGTAPTQHLYGLREALDMISQEGLGRVTDRHFKLASAYWAAFEVWGREGPIRFNIKDPGARSAAVTTLSIGAEYGTALRKWLIANAGVTLGIGLGMETTEDPNADGYFRVGHMGHLNTHMVMGVIGAIQAGMLALDIPHGKGGLEAAAALCSGVD